MAPPVLDVSGLKIHFSTEEDLFGLLMVSIWL